MTPKAKISTIDYSYPVLAAGGRKEIVSLGERLSLKKFKHNIKNQLKQNIWLTYQAKTNWKKSG